MQQLYYLVSNNGILPVLADPNQMLRFFRGERRHGHMEELGIEGNPARIPHLQVDRPEQHCTATFRCHVRWIDQSR